MTDEQMIKEIIERRRQWGETRASDFDWLINHIEYQQKTIDLLEKRKEELLVNSSNRLGKLIEIQHILDK